MVKKNDKLKHLDDFDSYTSDFDDLDIDFNKIDSDSKRVPVGAIRAGLTAGLKSTGKNLGPAIASRLEREMPDSANAVNSAFATINDVERMRKEFTTNIQPQLTQLKQTTKQLSNKFRDKLPGRISKLLDKIENPIQNRNRDFKEESRSAVIDQTTAEIFKIEQEQKLEDKKEERTDRFIDRKLNSSRHSEQLYQLDQIRLATMAQTEFSRSSQTAYMKKDLELKYRHFFVAKDQLSVTEKLAGALEQKLEEIRHNTSLPDIQKKKGSEGIKEAILGRMHGGFAKTVSQYTDKLKDNIKSKVFDSMKNTLSVASMMASGVSQSMQMSEGHANMIPGLVGDLGGNWLANKVVNSKVGNSAMGKISPYAKDLDQILRNGKEKFIIGTKNMKRNKSQNNGIVNSLLDLLPEYDDGLGRIENTFANSPLEETSFDIATRQSIIETIPGYLAKILQQTTNIATGRLDSPELVYDPNKRDFITSSSFKSSMMDKLTGGIDGRTNKIGSIIGKARGLAINSSSTDLKKFDSNSKDIVRLILNMATGPYIFNEQLISLFSRCLETSNYPSHLFNGIKDPSSVISVILTILSSTNGGIDAVAIGRMNNLIIESSRNDGMDNILANLTNGLGLGRHLNITDSDGFIKADDFNDALLSGIDKNRLSEQANTISKWDSRSFERNTKRKKKLTDDAGSNKYLSELYGKLNKISGADLDMEFGKFSTYSGWSDNAISGENQQIINDPKRRRKRKQSTNGTSDCCAELKEIFTKPIDVNIVGSGSNNISRLTGTDRSEIVQAIDIFRNEFIKYAEKNNIDIEVLRTISDSTVENNKVFKEYFNSFKSWAAETNILSMTQMEFLKNLNPNISNKSISAKTKSLLNGAGSGLKGIATKTLDTYKSIGLETLSLASKFGSSAGKGMGIGLSGIGGFLGKNLPGFFGGAKDTIDKLIGVYGGVLNNVVGGIKQGTSAVFNKLTGGKKGKKIFTKEEFCDIYIKGNIEIGKPLLSKNKLQSGVVFADGSIVKSSYDISQPIIDPETKQTLITIENITTGLVDVNNNSLTSTSSAAGGISKRFGAMLDGIGNIGKGLGGVYTDALKFGLGVGNDLYHGAKGFGKKLFGLNKGENSLNTEDIESIVGSRLRDIYELLNERLPENQNIRKGSYQEYAMNKKNKIKDKSSDKSSPISKKGIGASDLMYGGGLIEEGSSFVSDYIQMKFMDKYGGKLKGLLGKGKDKLGNIARGGKGLFGKGIGKLLGGGKGLLGLLGAGGAGLLGLSSGMFSGGSLGVDDMTNNMDMVSEVSSSMIPDAANSYASKSVGRTAATSTSQLAKAPDAKKAGFFGSLFKKFANILPDKFKKFFKGGIADTVMKRVGKSGVAKIIAKFSNPIGWTIAAGLATYAAVKGYSNAEEIMGVTDRHKDLTMAQKLMVGVANAISDTFTLGLAPTSWIASCLGVSVEEIKTKSDVDKEKEEFNQSERNKTLEDKQKDIDRMAIEPSKDGVYAASTIKPVSTTMSPTSQTSFDSNGNKTYQFGGERGAKLTAPSGVTGRRRSGSPSGTTSFKQDGLGSLSAQFESGNKSTSAIGFDARGGTSYGKYQIATRTGTWKNWIVWLKKQGPDGVTVASELTLAGDPDTGSTRGSVPDAWRKLAAEGRLQKFEHQFIKETHYDIAMRGLPGDIKTLVSGSKILQDVLWSTAVHHGPGSPRGSLGAVAIFKTSYQSGMSVSDFIQAIYKTRTQMFPKGTSRFRQEVQLAMGQVGNESYNTKEPDFTSMPGTSGENIPLSGSNNSPLSSGPDSSTGGGTSSSTGAYAGAVANSTSTFSGTGGDTSSLTKQPGVDLSMINPSMASNLTAMNEEYKATTGKPFLVTSGYRSIDKQAQLYREKGPKFAAKPGSSNHNFGVAVDINSSDANKLAGTGLLDKYNFKRRLAHEPWHIEPKDLNIPEVKKGGLDYSMDPSNVKNVAGAASASINTPTTEDGDKVEGQANKATGGALGSLGTETAVSGGFTAESSAVSNMMSGEVKDVGGSSPIASIDTPTSTYTSVSNAGSNIISAPSTYSDTSGPQIVSILTSILQVINAYAGKPTQQPIQPQQPVQQPVQQVQPTQVSNPIQSTVNQPKPTPPPVVTPKLTTPAVQIARRNPEVDRSAAVVMPMDPDGNYIDMSGNAVGHVSNISK